MIIGLISGITAWDRQMSRQFREGDDRVSAMLREGDEKMHNCINRIRDQMVDKDDQDRHLARIDETLREMREE